MENTQVAYHGEFTIEERKVMTAEALRELRKSKKLSQKEVAAELKIPATTYNTYESGRTEPPIEILVRLSHLYGIPTDLIVQRNRTYRTADDVNKQIAEFKQGLASYNEQLAENEGNNPALQGFLATLGKLADAMESYSQTELVRKAMENSLPK